MIFIKGNAARTTALGVSVIQLAVTLGMMVGFHGDGTFNHVVDLPWMPTAGIRFHIGYDGISMLMVLLTNLLVPFILLASSHHEVARPSLFYGLVMAMQAALVGVFAALDGLLFYIFWELALIPIYFIAAIYGGKSRQRITLKFFIYTFAGSLLMFVALIAVYLQTNVGGAHDFSLAALQAAKLPTQIAAYVALGFFVAFAIKIPIFPFHTWQPDTYTVSPVAGTMLLSGIMLKMGLYGLMRWMLPIAPEGFFQYQTMFTFFAVVGVVYASIIAIKQDDLKRLVAYSSIGHVGLIAAGIFSNTEVGFQGALIQMFNHGINVVGMFYIVDLIERRTGTRSLKALGGIAQVAPKFAVLFMIVLLGAVAVPLTNGFVGEFLLLNGVYTFHKWMGAIAGLTIIFGAVYMLRVYQHAMFGKTQTKTNAFQDVNTLEFAVLGVISAMILGFGIYPQGIFDLTAGSVSKLMSLIGSL